MVGAGRIAYDDFLAADDLRKELASSGVAAQNASPAETSQLLCAWCAWALQSLAEAFAGAHAGGENGPVPRITAQQIALITRETLIWSGRSRRAAIDPGYDVGSEVPLPAMFTAWVAVEPCPADHLSAMRAGRAVMVEKLTVALADSELLHTGWGQQIRGVVEEIRVGTAPGLSGLPVPGQNIHASEEGTLRDSVSRCYILGQVLARPRLLQPNSRLADLFPPFATWERVNSYGRGGHYDSHGHDGHH